MEKQKKASIYHGWWIVATGFLLMSLMFSPGVNLAGIFIAPIAAEFGASRTQVVTATTIMIFASIFGSLFSGKILARFEMRRVMCVCMLVSSSSWLGCALAPSLPVMYALGLLRGFCGPMVHLIPISILINNWFGPKTRGRAMGIALVGSGVGSMVLNPLVSQLIQNMGWRYGYGLFSLFGIVLLPVVWLVVRSTPQSMGLVQLGALASTPNGHAKQAGQGMAAAPLQGQGAKQALKGANFWLVAIALLLLNGVGQSWNSNGGSFLLDLGFSAEEVAGLFSVTAVGIIIGKLLLGYINDKISALACACTGMGFMLLGYLFAALVGYRWLAAAGVGVLIGIGISCGTVVAPLVSAILFGSKDFGVLVGYFNVGISLGSSLIPLLIALLFEGQGSFTIPALVSALLAALAIACINLAFYRHRAAARRG